MFEVKAGAAPGPDAARDLRWLRDAVGNKFAAGVVLHTGPRPFRWDDCILSPAHLRVVGVARSAVIGDGVRLSSTGRGYVLRRLLRRALTTLWREDSTRTLADLPTALLEHTLAHFGQDTGSQTVRDVVLDEERRFRDLLTRGRKVVRRLGSGRPLTEDDLRYLHETHGLPRDLVAVILNDQP